MLIIHAILYLVLCLALASLVTTTSTLLLLSEGYISIMLASFIRICYVLWLWRVSFLLLLIILGVLFVFYHVYNIYIVFWPPIVIVVWVGCICIEVPNILGLIVQRITIGKLSVVINDLYFLLYIFIIGNTGEIVILAFVVVLLNLLLRTQQKLINLTLTLMFNGIISSLDTRGIHWELTTTSVVLSSYLYSRLGTRWTWTGCSDLSMIPFVRLFHIFWPDILNLIIIIISSSLVTVIDNDTKFIKFIQASWIIQFTSSFVVVALCSSLHLVRINQFVAQTGCLWIRIWMVFITLHVSKAVRRFMSKLLPWFLIWVLILIGLVVFVTFTAPISFRKLIRISLIGLPSWTSTRFL